MANFNKDMRPRGKKTFSRGGRFTERDNSSMFRAVCSNCGKSCEVPFRPTNGKPVFCSDCFEDRQNTGFDNRDSRPERRSFDRPRFGGNDRGGEKRMFDAVCDNCGNKCSVPFQPTNGKPVYCNNCFSNQNDGPRNTPSSATNYSKDFELLNSKLDSLITLMTNKVTVAVEKNEDAPVEIVSETAEIEAKPKKKRATKKVA